MILVRFTERATAPSAGRGAVAATPRRRCAAAGASFQRRVTAGASLWRRVAVAALIKIRARLGELVHENWTRERTDGRCRSGESARKIALGPSAENDGNEG